MKKHIALCSMLVILATQAVAARPHSRLAPADEYFGRQKMSILGIKNSLRDTQTRVNFAPENAESQVHGCEMIQDSLEDFGSKYPHDTWLPGMIVSMERLYVSIHTPDSHDHATHFLAWVHAHFKGTWAERYSRLAYVGR